MYSIRQASVRSGVSVPLIRAWERRYGVVQPRRTASGYRLYDDTAIATLVRVRELTESGWSASEASRAVLAGEVPVLSLSIQPGSPLDGDAVREHRRGLMERFIEAATAMDIAGIGAALDEMFAQGSYESIVDDLLMPALVELGRAWSEGRLDVAAEHAASAAVHRRLSALYEAAASVGDPLLVVGLPPGSRHELGALAFAVAVRRRGVGVLYLGPDVPVASWVHVIGQNRARVAVVAVAQGPDRIAALDVAQALHDAGLRPTLAVGGGSARWGGAERTGMLVLPDRINEAAVVAARLVRGSSPAR
jgi:DNA-binding transcriptional MerR regulator/methylmalonyl-CoA mutase cobalamin-binding subunit